MKQVHTISYEHAVYLFFDLLPTHKINFLFFFFFFFFARALYKQIGKTIICNHFVIALTPNMK